MEPRYKIVYIALGLVAASMLGDVAAYGQASIESPYDGEWLAKVSCTESIYRRPPFTYQAKIPVEKGRIQKTFQNTQENTTTTNTWTGSFTNNELKIEINGSNSNGEKWRYLLKGELNSPYAVSLIGPYFDARGNKSRTCNIAFNSTKPDELRQAAQRAEQETARLKQELAQKDQALAAAQASAAAASTQAQQGLSQESQAAIDAQRQAAQRAEQETARLKQELAQKDQALAAAQASALSERNQLQQLAYQQAEAAANVQRQAGQKFALEIAQLRTELSQRSSEMGTLTETEAQRRNDLERTLRQEAQNSITAKQNEVQRLTSELADVKAQLSRSNPQIESLLEQEAKRRGELENNLRQESQAAIDAQRQATQRAEQEIARLKEELAQKDRIIEQERTASSAQLAQAQQMRVQEAQAAGEAQRQETQKAEREKELLKQELAQKDQALIAAQSSAAADRTQAQQAQTAGVGQGQTIQRAEQEIARLREELALKDRAVEQERKSVSSPQQQVAQKAVSNQNNSSIAPNNSPLTTNPSQLKLSLDKLAVDIGETKISGGGEIILKSTVGSAAQFDLKISNFDQLENLAKAETDPAPRNALALLKGYAETAGKELVWRLRFDNNKLTLNGQDLTSVMSELSRNGGVPIEAYQISRVLLNAMPNGFILDNHINIEGKLDFSKAGDPKGAITISLAGMEQLQSFVSNIPIAQELGPALALIRGSGDLKDGKVDWTFRFADQKIFLNSREIAKLALASASQEIAKITNSETSISTKQSVDIAQTNFLQIAIIGFTVAALTLLYRKLRQPRWKNLVRHGKVTIYLTKKRINLINWLKAFSGEEKTRYFLGVQTRFAIAIAKISKSNNRIKFSETLKIKGIHTKFWLSQFLRKMRSESGMNIKGHKVYGYHIGLAVAFFIIASLIVFFPQREKSPTQDAMAKIEKEDNRYQKLQRGEEIVLVNFDEGENFNYPYDLGGAEAQAREIYNKPLPVQGVSPCFNNEMQKKFVKGNYEELLYFFPTIMGKRNKIFCVAHQIPFTNKRSSNGLYQTFFVNEESVYFFSSASPLDRAAKLMVAAPNITKTKVNEYQYEYSYFNGAVEQLGETINLRPQIVVCMTSTIRNNGIRFTGKSTAKFGSC